MIGTRYVEWNGVWVPRYTVGGGVGTFFARTFHRLGKKQTPGCPCPKRQAFLDRWTRAGLPIPMYRGNAMPIIAGGMASPETVCSRGDILMCEDWEWSTNPAYAATAADWQAHGWDTDQSMLNNYGATSNVFCNSIGYTESPLCGLPIHIYAGNGTLSQPGDATLFPAKIISQTSLGQWIYARFYYKVQNPYVFNGPNPIDGSNTEQKVSYFRRYDLAWRVELQTQATNADRSAGAWQINPMPAHDINYSCNIQSCPLTPGTFECIEWAVRLPTSGADTDGGLRLWVNDVLRLSFDNIVITGGSTLPLDAYWLTGNYGGNPGAAHPAQDTWYDNIVVSRNRIGCISAAGGSGLTPVVGASALSGQMPLRVVGSILKPGAMVRG